MFFKNFIFAVLGLALITTYSCSPDDQIEADLTKTERVSSEFTNQFLHYNASLAKTRTALRLAQQEDGTNPFVDQFISAHKNPERFKRVLDQSYLLLNGKSLSEMLQIQKEYNVINQRQFDYLLDYVIHLESFVEENLSKDYLIAYTRYTFETTTLKSKFNAQEISQLQGMGINYMQGIYDVEDDGVGRTCDTFLQRLACSVVAGQAGQITSGVIILGGTIVSFDGEGCEAFLEFLGIDVLNLPNWLEELLGETVNIPGLGDVPLDLLVCGVAAGMGVMEFAYDWCCNTVYGCNEVADPCCAIECQIGYICVDGSCEIDPTHCLNSGCPEGYSCLPTTGNCYVTPTYDYECTTDSDCPLDHLCLGGTCHGM